MEILQKVLILGVGLLKTDGMEMLNNNMEEKKEWFKLKHS